MPAVNVFIWSHFVGTVIWDAARQVATFEFDDNFIKLGIDLAPLMMPLEDLQRGEKIFEFASLNKEVFHGLPGLLSDSLPDAFGGALLKTWLSRQGRDVKTITPVEQLSYIGSRGMGALRFEPAISIKATSADKLEVASLLGLANKVLPDRASLLVSLSEDEERALHELIKVGTSAGGQRGKAIVAYNEKTGEIRSGQLDLPEAFEHYLLKFDGVNAGELGDPTGYGRIEMAYYRMALDCGILMTNCRLLEENGRAHFMTRRFDRKEDGERIHMQTLCALAHYDYHQPGMYSYDDAFADMRELYLPYPDMEQLYKRMVFNIVARNQDDHTKNISFVLPENGVWRLSPAYDVNWSYNPSGAWTNLHQMHVSGKRDQFTKQYLTNFGQKQGIKNCSEIVDQIVGIVSNWPVYAKMTGVNQDRIGVISKTHRLKLN